MTAHSAICWQNASGNFVIEKSAMTVRRESTAQDLCNELFLKIEGALGDAWISDDAYTDDPAEYIEGVRGSLAALEEARKIMKDFLKKHGRKRPLSNRT